MIEVENPQNHQFEVKYSFQQDDQQINIDEPPNLPPTDFSISNADPHEPEPDLRKISQLSIRKEQQANLRFQIPPDFNLTLEHWDTGGIYDLQSGNKTKHIKDQNEEYEGESSSKRVKKVPYFTNPLTLKGFGTAILLYYLYLLCCLVILIELQIPLYMIGSAARQVYCEIYQELNQNKACSLLDLKSYQLAFFADPDYSKPKRQKVGADLVKNKIFYCLITVIFIYISILIFYLIQIKMELKYLREGTENSPSQFTVMVERVNNSE